MTNTMDGLWQKLLDGGVFNCSMCNQLPVSPVWLFPDEKNVCNTCYETVSRKKGKVNSELAIKNAVLDQILGELSFPCIYKKRGCDRVLAYVDYHKHVSECAYIQPCLIDGCLWTGTKQQLMMHLCDDHPEYELFGRNDVFPIVCTNKALDSIKVVQTKKGRFICRIKRDLEAASIVIFKNDYIEPGKGQFVLQYRTGPSTMVLQECTVCEDINCLTASETKMSTKVKFSPEDGTQTLELVYKSKGDLPLVPREFRSYFECHNCNGFITTQRWECAVGHQVCDTCSQEHDCGDNMLMQEDLIKIIGEYIFECADCSADRCTFWEVGPKDYVCQKCIGNSAMQQICQVKSSSIPNNLIYNFAFPCRFEALGCKFVGRLPRNHETTCDYNVESCPVCALKNRYCNLATHMGKAHRNVCTVQNRHDFSSELRRGTVVTFFFVCYNRCFVHKLDILGRKNTDLYRWTVEEVWPTQNEDFIYSVDIKGDLPKKLTMRYKCGTPITLNHHLVNAFLIGNHLQYSVTITRS